MRYFTSDCHFGHNNIIRFCNRPFTSVEEMNEKLVENWNKVVTKEDTVYCLGDFSMNNPKRFAERLNGKKILILGNHDSVVESKLAFDEVLGYTQIEIGGNKVHLKHYPYRENVGPYDKKFLHVMMQDDGNWLIHGHVHNAAPKLVGKSINASVEWWDYKPFSEKEVEIIMAEKTDALPIL